MGMRRRLRISSADASRGRQTLRAGGFSLLETSLSLLFLAAAVVFLPAFTQQLILSDVLWERRLAVRFIEGELDRACDFVANEPTGNGFDLLTSVVPPLGVPPPELSNPIVDRTVMCLNGDDLTEVDPELDGSCPNGEELKRARVTIQWMSRGIRQVSQTSADYWISQLGLCGTGAS